MIKDEAPDAAFSRQIVVALDWADEVTRIERPRALKAEPDHQKYVFTTLGGAGVPDITLTCNTS